MNTEALREDPQDHNLDEIDSTESASPEKELIRGLREGSNESFKELQRLYYPRLYAFAIKQLWNREDAEDVLQQAFVKVFRVIKNFRDGNFFVWLCTIVRNLCTDVLRKRVWRNEVSLPDQGKVVDKEIVLFNPQPFGEAPDVCLMRRRIMYKLASVVDGLSEKHKQALLLFHIEGRDYKEMAEIMGVPKGTVMSRLFWARKVVREKMMDVYKESLAA